MVGKPSVHPKQPGTAAVSSPRGQLLAEILAASTLPVANESPSWETPLGDRAFSLVTSEETRHPLCSIADYVCGSQVRRQTLPATVYGALGSFREVTWLGLPGSGPTLAACQSPPHPTPPPPLAGCSSSRCTAESSGAVTRLVCGAKQRAREELRPPGPEGGRPCSPGTSSALAAEARRRGEGSTVWFKNRRAKWRHQKRASAAARLLPGAKKPPKERC
ncbi:Homeobox protein goosecoid-2 [Fukomys damarensis]|uniref:Homeobox protein goosecoid-2 n=1 Tax=Fukomys damarensis TaxID=885580 RepID=A0A091DUS3_FUKDA|nr:Homeobox protein goosecoid-2 [Fukomys damarensis]